MFKKQSLWFRGLKYAEEIGAREAEQQLMMNEFDDCCRDFDVGVADYIRHAKNNFGAINGTTKQ